MHIMRNEMWVQQLINCAVKMVFSSKVTLTSLYIKIKIVPFHAP